MKLSKEEKSKLTKEQFRYYKQHGVLPVVPAKESTDKFVPPTTITSHGSDKITVLCVRFGTKYGREYVERLRNMVQRYFTVPHEIACLTDDYEPIEGVRTIFQPQAGYNKLWWHKVHMFDPDLPITGRILYLDLDVIIANDMNKLVSNLGNSFMGIQDFNRKFHSNWQYLNSSTMSWMHRSHSYIWEQFRSAPKEAQRLHGDQDWIWKIAKDRIKFWPKSWIQSYKWEIRSREEIEYRNGIRRFKSVKDVKIPDDCSIVVFHGDPKPEDIKDPFVVDNWI
jgi:hypothetical protein